MEEDKDRKACDGAKEPEEPAAAINAGGPDPDNRQEFEAHAALEKLRERMVRAQANLDAPVHPRKYPVPVMAPHEPLVRPTGDAAALLEHQLASGAALMDYIAHFIARPDTDPGTCISFMDQMSSLLGANAQIGKVIGRLRGQVSESRQTISVERKTIGGPGEGVPES
jgi:hypothetical protein